MTREIKFRCWDEDEQKWFYYDLDFIVKKGLSKPYYLINFCQFTGLKDRNGKEIYEGDIFQHGERLGKVFVEWDYGKYILKSNFFNEKKEVYETRSILKATEGEIIGNIYEHPNLIKN